MNKPNEPVESDLHNRQHQWYNITHFILTVFCDAMNRDVSSKWWYLPTQLTSNAFGFAGQSNFSEQDTAPWLWYRTFILNMMDGNLETQLAPYSLVGEAGNPKTRVVRFPEFDASYPYDFFVKAWWQDADILLEKDVVSLQDITRITDRHCLECGQFVETSDFLNNNWDIVGRVDGDSKWGYMVNHTVCAPKLK